jgi:hypothetical protein
MKNILTLLFLLATLPLIAQIVIEKGVTTTNNFQTHVLTTNRGDVFIGRAISLDSGTVRFNVRNANQIELKFKEVDTISLFGGKWIDYIYKNNFAERTALMPTAFSMEKGGIEYHNEMLFVNTVNYGVTDQFTIGAGGVVFPYFYFYNIHLKLSQPLGQNIHVAAGTMLGSGLINDGYVDGGTYVGRYLAPFGSITLGTRHDFLSASVGKVYYFEDEDAESPEWIYCINGALRPLKRLRLYMEVGNILNTYSSRVYNAGLGVIGKKSIFNIGLFFGEDVYGVFPCLSYSRRIRQR